MNAHATSFRTGSTWNFQRASDTGIFGKMDNSTEDKGHLLFCWTANDLLVPIQDKCLFRESLPLADRPGFAIDFEFITPFSHKMATQIAPVDMEFC